jgi:hypothetical protein
MYMQWIVSELAVWPLSHFVGLALDVAVIVWLWKSTPIRLK